ncbi:MAG TPA: hypothetical protein VGA06_02575 [Candidatus Paceibacterota bacterium]|jgi:hypothetical protein
MLEIDPSVYAVLYGYLPVIGMICILATFLPFAIAMAPETPLRERRSAFGIGMAMLVLLLVALLAYGIRALAYGFG